MAFFVVQLLFPIESINEINFGVNETDIWKKERWRDMRWGVERWRDRETGITERDVEKQWQKEIEIESKERNIERHREIETGENRDEQRETK